MNAMELTDLLQNNSYPGRGIVLGRSCDGKNAVMIYFIMGRSENSRNRIFVEKDGGIITQAFDESKLQDPSLIIYAPVRVIGHNTIVTNGDQTDTIYDYFYQGKGFEDALRTRTFEPDAPNFTPRISGTVDVYDKWWGYRLSILKTVGGNENCVNRCFFDYPQPQKGEGHFIHTYQGDGNPIPSFEGEPERVKLHGDIDKLTKAVWESLNEDNKVSLFVRYLNVESGKAETRIVNKNVK